MRLIAVTACLAALALAAASGERAESATLLPAQLSGSARHAMVAAANPLAVAAGLAVLRRGGSAVDAAVAVQAVLGLVEPQSSGLGGGAFLVFYDAKTRRVTAYDGRETAPAGITRNLLLGADGKPLPHGEAMLGGISTGVPGAIAMLELAHRQHGRLAWRGLFAPAQDLALRGFTVSARLASMIASSAPQASAPDVIGYFSKPGGARMGAGDQLVNPAYARTLALVAREGAAALLTGPIAGDIVTRLHTGPHPGTMTLADLAGYRPHAAPALCRPYHAYVVCTPQAPSGGPALQEALGLLAHTDIAPRSPADERAWFTFAQASRLAYADRDRYEGDPAFVNVPVAGLLAPDYLAARARLIGENILPVTFGHPAGALTPGADATQEPGGTSHFVIVDTRGNVVSMTTTVESIFGSGRMVDGFFLNNQLTDFSSLPSNADGTAAANAPAPGKRPRSSMSPTIVLTREGRFVAAFGSPGGSSIIAYTLKMAVALLDWHMPPQAAAALPNLVAHGGDFSAEPFPAPVMTGLAARGMPLKTDRGEASGIHAILRRGEIYEGAADPRREGVARGF